MALLSVEVQGRAHRWSFTFDGDPAHLDDWLADGLDVSQVVNTIPVDIVDAGLLRPWVKAQDEGSIGTLRISFPGGTK